MRSFSLAVLGLLAVPLLAAPQAETSVFEAVKAMNMDPKGYIHYADDGVARSYDGNHDVIDYVRLTNKQIMELLSAPWFPESYQKEMNHLHSVFDGVNGIDVVDEHQLRNPPLSLRPAFQQEANKSSVSTARPRNLVRDAGSALETRSGYYCAGQPCTSSTACQFLGCSYCSSVDGILPGGLGVCTP